MLMSQFDSESSSWGRLVKVIDLSVPLEDGMPTWSYPLPPPYTKDIYPPVSITETATHDSDLGCSMRTMVIHTHAGTHLDIPYHLLRDGKKLDEIPLESYMGEAVVLDFQDKGMPGERITADDLEKYADKVRAGDIVLIRTGWEKNLGSDTYFKDYRYPQITEDAAEWLVKAGIKALGMDVPGIGPVSAHKILLKREIVIIENLINLLKISEERVKFMGLPLPIKGSDGGPIRAVVIQDTQSF